MLLIKHKQNSWLQTSQTGGQTYCVTSPNEVNECSLFAVLGTIVYLPTVNCTEKTKLKGKKSVITQFKIHLSPTEAEKMELINNAAGAAEAVVAAGRARAQSIELVAKALSDVNGQNAASLAVAEKYVSAFQELARTNNTLILPANTGDVTSMVAQVALSTIFLIKLS